MTKSRPLLAAAASAFLCHTPADALYVRPPDANLAPGETRVTVNIASGSLSGAQGQIDAARAANPGAVLVIHMSGTYAVTSSPLRLPSRSSLVLIGTIRAGAGVTAGSLISIVGQSKVAVAGGTLDGAGAAVGGLSIVDSSKINVDGVTVRNTGRDGISLDGAGNGVWNTGSSIVRCDVSGSAANGIVVKELTQAIVADNAVHDNAAVGIDVRAAHSIVTNNTSEANGVGIDVEALENAVSKNTLSGNGTGLRLGAGSTNNACFQNTIRDSTGAAIVLAGTNNFVYANDLAANGSAFTNGGSGNYVVPDSQSLSASGNHYFYPPTIGNRHTSPTIVNGRGRFDVNIGGTSLTNVQSQYDAARAAHPNDFIVLNLTGAFTHSTAGLTLQSFSAVVLNGTVTVSGGTGASIGAPSGTSFVSVSGGTFDGQGRPAPALQLRSVMAYVDRVTVRRYGVKERRTSGGLIHLAGAGGYAIIRGSRVDVGGGRCIWTQNAGKRYIVLDNFTSNCQMDGIDFDSHTADSIAHGNRSDDNTRYGLFIEEGAARNKAWDNDFNRNERGLNFFSFNSGNTDRSTVAMNRIGGNSRGLCACGAKPGLVTNLNFAFNNVITNNGTGLEGVAGGNDNYFSQNILSGNTNSYPTTVGADFFNSLAAPAVAPVPTATPTPTSPIATPTPTPTPTPCGACTDVEITPPGSAVTASTSDVNLPANAVDDDLATRWSGNGEAWLQLDLGAVRTVSKVHVAVYNGNARRNRFDLQVATVSGAWTTVWSGESTGTTTAEEAYDFDDVPARWVRYVGHGSNVGTFNSVTEVSVFAPAASVPVRYEAEALTITARSGDASAVNSESGASAGRYVLYSSNAAGDALALRIPNVSAGRYAVTIGYKRYTTRGIVQAFVGPEGGTPAALGSPIDMNGTTAFPSVALGTWTVAASGDQTVELRVTGSSGSGHTTAVDFITLAPQ